MPLCACVHACVYIYGEICINKIIYVLLEVWSKKDIFSLSFGVLDTTLSVLLISLAPAANSTGDETLCLSAKKYSFCNREKFPSVRVLKPLLGGLK